MIFASHSARLPPMLATQCSSVSSSWRTDSTPDMKLGNSSNCVHWLYAVVTGTPTSIEPVTTRPALGIPRPTPDSFCMTGLRAAGTAATVAAPPSSVHFSSRLRVRCGCCFCSARAHAVCPCCAAFFSSRRNFLSVASSLTSSPLVTTLSFNSAFLVVPNMDLLPKGVDCTYRLGLWSKPLRCNSSAQRIGEASRDREGRRRRRRRRVQDVQRRPVALEEEVVDEGAVAGERLRADAAG